MERLSGRLHEYLEADRLLTDRSLMSNLEASLLHKTDVFWKQPYLVSMLKIEFLPTRITPESMARLSGHLHEYLEADRLLTDCSFMSNLEASLLHETDYFWKQPYLVSMLKIEFLPSRITPESMEGLSGCLHEYLEADRLLTNRTLMSNLEASLLRETNFF